MFPVSSFSVLRATRGAANVPSNVYQCKQCETHIIVNIKDLRTRAHLCAFACLTCPANVNYGTAEMLAWHHMLLHPTVPEPARFTRNVLDALMVAAPARVTPPPAPVLAVLAPPVPAPVPVPVPVAQPEEISDTDSYEIVDANEAAVQNVRDTTPPASPVLRGILRCPTTGEPPLKRQRKCVAFDVPAEPFVFRYERDDTNYKFRAPNRSSKKQQHDTLMCEEITYEDIIMDEMAVWAH